MTEVSLRPGGVKALCVIAIVLGSLGLAGVILGAAGHLSPPRLRPPIPEPKLADLNAEWERRIQDLHREAQPLYWGFLPFSTAASVLLLMGGILGLKGRRRALLGAALGGSLGVDAVAAVLGILVTNQTVDAMDWYAREAAAVTTLPSGMSAARAATLWAALVLAGGWLLLKSVFYAWGLFWLRRPAVRAFFEGTATSSAPAPSSPATGGGGPS
jgi:hypothetical protein